ncbi:hypothetical protein [Oceanihabitans sediminis]|uniref:hypothetical protein n=1 Tax=Oceanihabitans sediminis TaxID=1812012 RepID=UPI00299D3AE7|nr:hypothetical protein [Oceanihabitans sediminis]MDX1279357.1 hypothetical protein [Oceanihabitans sediminis]
MKLTDINQIRKGVIYDDGDPEGPICLVIKTSPSNSSFTIEFGMSVEEVKAGKGERFEHHYGDLTGGIKNGTITILDPGRISNWKNLLKP